MKQNQENREDEFSIWMREFYNKKAKNLSEKGYEHGRWFSSKEKRKQYEFSRVSLLHHLKNLNFKNCLEIGCGPGTWTKFLLDKFPDSKIDCLDISKEMISQHKNNVKSKRVKRIVSNFLLYNTNKKYDFIFFSRSIEYIPNKDAVIKKMSELMKHNAKGVIITSPPHPLILFIKRFFGKKINKNHTQRIDINSMRNLLLKYNLRDVRFYPILFSDFRLVPTSLLFNKFYKKPWGLISKMFATGYFAVFTKNGSQI